MAASAAPVVAVQAPQIAPALPPPPPAASVGDGQPTVDVMARQTAAGFRAAGPLLGGLAGGSAEGIDLTPPARRVLHAQKMLCGIRAAGALIITPPPGELPPVLSYPQPPVGSPPVPTPHPGGPAQPRLAVGHPEWRTAALTVHHLAAPKPAARSVGRRQHVLHVAVGPAGAVGRALYPVFNRAARLLFFLPGLVVSFVI